MKMGLVRWQLSVFGFLLFNIDYNFVIACTCAPKSPLNVSTDKLARKTYWLI